MTRLSRFVAGAAIVACALGWWAPRSAAAEPAPDLAVFSQPVPESQPLGGAPPTDRLRVVLRLDTPTGLDAAVAAINDTSSPQYRRYLDLPTLQARFGASAATIQSVLRALDANGVRGTVDATRSFINAPMNAAQVEAIFGIGLRQYRAPTGQTFVAPARRPANTPEMARGIPGVVAIAGLSNASVARPVTQPTPPLRPERYDYNNSGTQSGCANARATGGYTPNQLRRAYGFNSLYGEGLRGEGQSVAILAIDGFSQPALDAYTACFGLPRIVPNVKPVAGTTTRLPPGLETQLDTQTIAAFAPNVNKIHVLETDTPDETIFSQLISAALDPANTQGQAVKVQSISLGACEQAFSGPAPLDLIERTALRAAAMGVTIAVASGDDGSAQCRMYDASNPGLNFLAVSVPASTPWVTAVGGTNLQLDSSNRIVDERVWNNTFPAFGGGVVAASGGGDSAYFPMPQYQRDAGITGPARAVPDIALYGDIGPGWVVNCSGVPTGGGTCSGFTTVGGTSFAAPLFAAQVALANQRLAQLGQPPVGFVNPFLYRTGRGGGAGVFRDVVNGTNDMSRATTPLGCCDAIPGFDRASGWGSVNATNFVRNVVKPVPGLLLGDAQGNVYPLGSARSYGSLVGVPLQQPIVALASRPQRDGYWLFSADGGVFTFGDAPFLGSLGGITLNKPIVGGAATPDGLGYLLVSSDGGVFTFGTARFAGSLGGITLNNPIVGVAIDPRSGGYWMVSSDGGVFAFGGAPFLGSLGGVRLLQPIAAMAATPTGGGYWMFSTDGGVFAFGGAPFLDSAFGVANSRVMGGVSTSTGKGYWLISLTGGVFAFGDAPFLGTPGRWVSTIAPG